MGEQQRWTAKRKTYNATAKRVNNAKVESVNAIIQKLKVTAFGFRNRARFKMAILFHCGKLSLLPEGLT